MPKTITFEAPSQAHLAPENQRPVTVVITPKNANTVSGTATATEYTNKKSVWYITTTLAAGLYDLSFSIGSVCAGRWEVELGNADNTTYEARQAGQVGGDVLQPGPNTVTITVTDVAAAALQNASVRLRLNNASDYKVTPLSGVVAFAVPAGTYELSVACTGYISSVGSLVVGADVSQTVALTTAGVTPSGDPATTTGYATIRDPNNVIEPGAVVKVKLDTWPSGSGQGYDTAVKDYTADNAGLIQVPGMLKGATYIITRGSKKNEQTVTVPSNAGATWAITNFGGAS